MTRWGRARRCAAVLALLLLAACATSPQHDLSQSSLPLRRDLADVPFFSQNDQQCGAAALATVLAYWQQPVDLQQLQQRLFIPGKGGTLALDIVATARQRGLLAYPIEPSLLSLLREVHAGHPVLVMQNLGFSWFPQWHFAVAVGFDRQARELILRSGEHREYRLAFSAFLRTWERADYWGSVIVPATQLPVTARPLPYLRVLSALEPVQPQAAREGYLRALQQWPRDSDVDVLARLGLANIAYGQRRYADARAWLLKGGGMKTATQWNNLAFILASLGCVEQAGRAMACAQKLEPDNPVFAQSARELDAWVYPSGTQAAAVCGIPDCP